MTSRPRLVARAGGLGDRTAAARQRGFDGGVPAEANASCVYYERVYPRRIGLFGFCGAGADWFFVESCIYSYFAQTFYR